MRCNGHNFKFPVNRSHQKQLMSLIQAKTDDPKINLVHCCPALVLDMRAFIELALLKRTSKLNHFRQKTKPYVNALRAFSP